jgi:PHD/YefM family antitoxin component YafN of YafNO toxin-antitoxin module
MSATIEPTRCGAALRVANEELATIRQAMRELNRMVEALERGQLDKVVLTQRNRMRAVLVSLERFSELEREAGGLPDAPRAAA